MRVPFLWYPPPDSRVTLQCAWRRSTSAATQCTPWSPMSCEGKLEDVAHYVEMPELGPQVARTGAIGSRAKPAIQALRSVVERARTHGFEVLIAGATEAVRQATDRDAFVREASHAIGVPVHIISAQQRGRAELPRRGEPARGAARVGDGRPRRRLDRGRDRAMAASMVRSATLPVGSGVLASTYLSDPPKPDERARLRRAALRELDPGAGR